MGCVRRFHTQTYEERFDVYHDEWQPEAHVGSGGVEYVKGAGYNCDIYPYCNTCGSSDLEPNRLSGSSGEAENAVFINGLLVVIFLGVVALGVALMLSPLIEKVVLDMKLSLSPLIEKVVLDMKSSLSPLVETLVLDMKSSLLGAEDSVSEVAVFLTGLIVFLIPWGLWKGVAYNRILKKNQKKVNVVHFKCNKCGNRFDIDIPAIVTVSDEAFGPNNPKDRTLKVDDRRKDHTRKDHWYAGFSINVNTKGSSPGEWEEKDGEGSAKWMLRRAVQGEHSVSGDSLYWAYTITRRTQ